MKNQDCTHFHIPVKWLDGIVADDIGVAETQSTDEGDWDGEIEGQCSASLREYEAIVLDIALLPNAT